MTWLNTLSKQYGHITQHWAEYLQAKQNHARYMLQQQHWLAGTNIPTKPRTMRARHQKNQTTQKSARRLGPHLVFLYDPCPNDKRRIGIRWSGKSNSLDHCTFYGKPWGTSPRLNSVCTPLLCRNMYLASNFSERLLALSSLAYLMKKRILLLCAWHAVVFMPYVCSRPPLLHTSYTLNCVLHSGVFVHLIVFVPHAYWEAYRHGSLHYITLC